MTSLERIQAVLSGKLPDRPPYSFWYHFPKGQESGPAAVKAHLDELAAYEMDFLKVMDDNPYPHPQPIRSAADLATLQPLNGDEGGFGRQLEVIAELRKALGAKLHMVSTVFNAWYVLRQLVEPPDQNRPPEMDAMRDVPSRWLREAYAAHPEAVADALRTIAGNLAKFAAKCLAAGADGIFLSVRDDWVDVAGSGEDNPSLYQQIVRPRDLEILAAVRQGSFNILHVCGTAVDFVPFGAYPAHAISWADRQAGPSIAEARDTLRLAMCAGVDNLVTLPRGTPEQVAQQVEDAVRQAGHRPIIIAPGCTFDPVATPKKNLEALVKAARGAVYHKTASTMA